MVKFKGHYLNPLASGYSLGLSEKYIRAEKHQSPQILYGFFISSSPFFFALSTITL